MDTAAILRDLAKAKAAFQLRTIEAIITERPMNDESRAPNQESAANTTAQTNGECDLLRGNGTADPAPDTIAACPPNAPSRTTIYAGR